MDNSFSAKQKAIIYCNRETNRKKISLIEIFEHSLLYNKLFQCTDLMGTAMTADLVLTD